MLSDGAAVGSRMDYWRNDDQPGHESPVRWGGMRKLSLLEGMYAQASETHTQKAHPSHCGHLFFMVAVGCRGLEGPTLSMRQDQGQSGFALSPSEVPAGAGSGNIPYLTGFGHGLCL